MEMHENLSNLIYLQLLVLQTYINLVRIYFCLISFLQSYYS